MCPQLKDLAEEAKLAFRHYDAMLPTRKYDATGPLARFASLVAASERARCVRACLESLKQPNALAGYGRYITVRECAALIDKLPDTYERSV